jgi:hypothetical protein
MKICMANSNFKRKRKKREGKKKALWVINHASTNQSHRPKRKRKGDFGHQDAPLEGHRSLRHILTTFFIYFYSNIIFLLN